MTTLGTGESRERKKKSPKINERRRGKKMFCLNARKLQWENENDDSVRHSAVRCVVVLHINFIYIHSTAGEAEMAKMPNGMKRISKRYKRTNESDKISILIMICVFILFPYFPDDDYYY